MKLTIYRVFSFLLAPIAVLFSICFLVFIRAAFTNPAMLFPLIMIACIAIYSFISLYFLIKGIDGNKLLGKSSNIWLRVTGFISTIFCILMISQCIILIIHPEMMQQLADQAKQNAGTDLKISEGGIEKYLRITSYFFLVYAIVLFIHAMFSFQYVKQYNFLFRSPEK